MSNQTITIDMSEWLKEVDKRNDARAAGPIKSEPDFYEGLYREMREL